MNADFEVTYPAGAAHAASEYDEYDDAAPEGAAIVVGLLGVAVAIVGFVVAMVLL